MIDNEERFTELCKDILITIYSKETTGNDALSAIANVAASLLASSKCTAEDRRVFKIPGGNATELARDFDIGLKMAKEEELFAIKLKIAQQEEKGLGGAGDNNAD